ncbi:MAG: glycosyltransferase 87 family protein [Thaumarchaeota archaeon]|nr:glycosyltransferase 87 family protein [Nitrososphaerota archaeon]
MAVWTSRSRTIFGAAVLCLIALNLVVLAAAYPETTTIDSGCCGDRLLAKDFSAFYTAAWRLIHDPGQVYTSGYVNDGEYHILPQPESYKYLPSFLLMVLPFTALSYQQALTAFDVFQFLLLPLIALLVYELTKEKGVAVAVIVAIIALLVPSPSPHWSLSATYYWQWGEGQSKVLETFLLLLGLQLGKSKRPLLSGVVFGLCAFDPRFAILALPLFFMYNRPSLWKAFGAGAATLLASNATLLVPGVGSGFLTMLFTSGLTTPLYWYALIPLFTIVALTIVNLREVIAAFRTRTILTHA